MNLESAIIALDAYANCPNRSCDICREIYNMTECPTSYYKDQFAEVVKILEKAKDYEHDHDVILSEEDMIRMFGE